MLHSPPPIQTTDTHPAPVPDRAGSLTYSVLTDACPSHIPRPSLLDGTPTSNSIPTSFNSIPTSSNSTSRRHESRASVRSSTGGAPSRASSARVSLQPPSHRTSVRSTIGSAPLHGGLSFGVGHGVVHSGAGALIDKEREGAPPSSGVDSRGSVSSVASMSMPSLGSVPGVEAGASLRTLSQITSSHVPSSVYVAPSVSCGFLCERGLQCTVGHVRVCVRARA